MRKFVINIALFSLITLGTLYGIQYALDMSNRNRNSDIYAEWNECYNPKNQTDVLIMGASRAWVQFSPAILDSILHINAYNLGIDGWPFLMQHCRLKVYLAHNPLPKCIIHSVDALILEKRPDLYQAEQFAPYLSDTLIQRYTSGYKGSFNFLHYNFPLYKYNYALKSITTATLDISGLKKGTTKKYKGYLGSEANWDNTFDNFVKNNPNGIVRNMDKETLQEFEDYMAFCKEKNIQLIFVYAPEYLEAQKMTINRDSFVQLYQKYADTYNFKFLNYSSDTLCSDKSFFYNSQHLNKKGAEIFSTTLAHDLENIIKPSLTTVWHIKAQKQ